MNKDETLKEYINYDKDSGILTWKKIYKHRKRFGSAVNVYPDKAGYLVFVFNNKNYKTHRVAWFLYYGKWPNQIDHINGNKKDNRVINLRNVTHTVNNFNKKLRSNNTSKKTGINWCCRYKKWRARINVKGVTYFLGYFNLKKEAVRVRLDAEIKYYGEYCRG